MTTFSVSITIEGVTYNYEIHGEESLRELFASITVPVDDFMIYEMKGAVIAEMTYSQIARILEPSYAAA